MALFGLFRDKSKEEEKVEEIVKEGGIDPNATLIKNEILCNACGKEIDQGIPRFLNYNGRKMVFHKKCLKKLKAGNISF